jgi:hypothetical protein
MSQQRTRRFPPPWTVEQIPGGYKVINLAHLLQLLMAWSFVSIATTSSFVGKAPVRIAETLAGASFWSLGLPNLTA